MKDHNKKNIISIIIISLALFIIGIAFLSSSVNMAKNRIQSNLDEHILGLNEILDNKILDYFEQCQKELKYISNSVYYNNAEAQWKKTGESHSFYAVLSKNLLLDSGMLSHIYVTYPDGSRIAFPDPTRLYTFPFDDEDSDIRICIDKDGVYYLAFFYDSTHSSGTFVGLTKLEAFHEIISQNTVNETHVISIYDPISGICMCNNISSLNSILVMNSDKNDPIVAAQFSTSDTDAESAISLSIKDNNDKDYNIRSVALPTEAQNSPRFRICISIDDSSYRQTFHTLSIRFVLTYLLIIFGIILMVICVFVLSRRNITARKEIHLLQEKKRITDEIISRSNELEHFQRLETLGVMSSSIAHEFNNLLTPIMGYSYLAMDKTGDNTDLLSDINEIYVAASKAQALISGLTGYIHKKERYTPIESTPDSILNDLINMVTPLIPEGVTMKMNLNCKHISIYTDILQTNQVYLNIIINALQAMKDTGGELNISTYSENGHAVVSFRDTGPGISDELKEKIFDIFYTTKNEKGTGLGLAIVKRILDMQGATISVLSVPGKGAEFIITYDHKSKIND